MDTSRSKTNITDEHRRFFKPLLDSWSANVCLVSCFVNGKPAVAIAEVSRDGTDYIICPKYVSITDDMVITDHDGRRAEVL